jgi:coiled-coil-helix-coiled-coil-helix domain-containing protein 3
MGAGASTSRRLTVRNDDPRIIQVSEDVVRRLKSSGSGDNRGSQQYREEKTSSSESQTPTQPQPQPMYPSPQIFDPQSYVLGFGASGQPTIETISALEVRKQKEEELKANDEFWRQKLREIEQRYVKAEVAVGDEFNRQLAKLSALVPVQGEQKCKEMSTKVAECYRTHPNQPLKCSGVVKEFAKCVYTEVP